MDDIKCGQNVGRVRYGHRYQGLGVICIDCGARETKPGAVELVATTSRTILGMKSAKTPVWINADDPKNGVEYFREHILIATSDGVFERGDDGVFRECKFERGE